MSLFTYISGVFECVRCGHVGPSNMQTYLFVTNDSNNGCVYTVGDRVTLDDRTLGDSWDYPEIQPWGGPPRLDVVTGDWDCDRCRLNWQWARVSFSDVSGDARTQPADAFISSISTFVPDRPSAFDGVHFIEAELAVLGLPERRGRSGLDAFVRMNRLERIHSIVEGHRRWLDDMKQRVP